MLKAFFQYVQNHLPFNSQSVKSQIKAAVAKQILAAEARAQEDIQFHTDEFNKAVANAVNTFLVNKEAAVTRQVNQFLSRLTQ